MIELLGNLRQELKNLSLVIRNHKQNRKNYPNGYVPELANLQFEFRVKHIFRCLLRGKTLEQIENFRITNRFSETYYPEIKLQRALSHIFRKYANKEYSGGISCNCLDCSKEWKG